ncbi:hypothetical protein B0H21DRAFT_713422, partial [Amylocystis lapponica]
MEGVNILLSFTAASRSSTLTASGPALDDLFPANISGYILAPPLVLQRPLSSPPFQYDSRKIRSSSVQHAHLDGKSNERDQQGPSLNLVGSLQEREDTVRIRVERQRTHAGLRDWWNSEIVGKLGDVQDSDPIDATYKVMHLTIGGNAGDAMHPSYDLRVGRRIVVIWDTVQRHVELQPADCRANRLGLVLGLQAGNKPEIYAKHNHRLAEHTPLDYSDLRSPESAVAAGAKIPDQNDLGLDVFGPWTPDDVWNTGFVRLHASSL